MYQCYVSEPDQRETTCSSCDKSWLEKSRFIHCIHFDWKSGTISFVLKFSTHCTVEDVAHSLLSLLPSTSCCNVRHNYRARLKEANLRMVPDVIRNLSFSSPFITTSLLLLLNYFLRFLLI